MKMEDRIESINRDIQKHFDSASYFRIAVNWAIFVEVLVVFWYLSSDIAERALPELEKEYTESMQEYESAQAEFFQLYKEKFQYLSDDDFEKLPKSKSATAKYKKAREISKERPNPPWITRFLAALKVGDEKMNLLLKVVSIIFGGVLAGFVLIYLLHIWSAKELSLKKIEIIAMKLKYAEKSRQSREEEEI